MFIRKLIVHGIRSLADVKLDFANDVNVVVARNGSGKSNLILAMQLVLCDKHLTLTSRERLAILHHVNANRSTKEGFVEIVVDNRDPSFQNKNSCVLIRRTITEAEDWYLVNGKKTEKRAVVCLWKSAGFSAQIPFHTLDKAMISLLVEGGDARRLNLLHSFTGFAHHEEMLQGDVKLLRKNFPRREHVTQGNFVNVARWCEEAEPQLAKCAHLFNANESVNALELIILRRKRSAVQDALKLWKRKYSKEKQYLDRMIEVESSFVERREWLEQSLNKKREQLTYAAAAVDTLKQKLHELYARISDGGTGNRAMELDPASDVLALNIAAEEKILPKLSNDCENLKNMIMQREKELVKKVVERNLLYAKQGRSAKHESREERDRFLMEEIEKIRVVRNAFNEKHEKVVGQMRTHRETMEKSEAAYKKLVKEIEHNERRLHEMEKERKEIVDKMWKCNSDKESILAQLIVLRKEIKKFEQNAYGADFQAHRGITGIIEEWTKENIPTDEYHGILLDKIHCDKKFNIAVDVVGNKRLFFHIVATDAFATKLTKRFNEKRLRGSINLIALNRIPKTNINHQGIDPETAVPLLHHLQYDQQYETLMKLIFGNVLLCQENVNMTSIAKQHRVNCVLLDGTFCSLRGALTGGYFDCKMSKLHYKDQIKNLADHEAQLSVLTNAVIQLTGRCDYLFSEIVRCRANISKNKAESNWQEHEISELAAKVQNKDEKQKKLKSFMDASEAQVDYLNRELESDFLQDLTPKEREHLHELCRSINELQADISLWNNKLPNFQNRVDSSREKLNSYKARNEAFLRAIDAPLRDNVIPAEQEAEISVTEDKLKIENERLEEAKKDIFSLKKKLYANQEEHNATLAKQDEQNNLLRNIECKIKIFQTQISCLDLEVGKREETVNIDYVNQFKHCIKEELFRSFHKFRKIVREMKPEVNKCAYDMHRVLGHLLTNATAALNKFMNIRQTALASLDESNLDAIAEFSFSQDQIKARFREQCQKLIPGVSGTINMRKEGDNITGVEISVSFNGHRPTTLLTQLSGSQKMLVSLAFLFSMRDLSRSPIYLFDEIDASLDSRNARKVATQIKRFSPEAQFIIATLNSDLVSIADRCFGVVIRDGVSRVERVTHQQALDLLQTMSPSRRLLQFDDSSQHPPPEIEFRENV